MKKPKGMKFRNLHSYRGTIWYERVVRERRYRVNTGTSDWSEAALFRDKYEDAKKIGRKSMHTGAVPFFSEMAARYLDEDMTHLAATTRVDRHSHLQPDGPVLRHLGRKRLDDISPATLREWWNIEILAIEKNRTASTGRCYLASIAGVLSYAVELGYLSESPVDAFRKQLSRRRRSKKGREEESAKVRPIRNPADVSRLVETAAEHGTETRALVLALLDAGLRLGEALALRWCSIAWGSDEDDPRRHLAIDRTCSRGGELDSPKSGRARKVQLSRRLRAALGDLYLARFQRDPRAYEAEALIFAGIDHRRFREGIWARIIREADLPGVVPKDLRDTFGSWLVSMGIPLQYVSRQLGHSTTVVTEKHYARWIPEDDLYMEPERLRPGETPADLLARLSESPQSPHRGDPFAMPNFLQVP